MLTGEAKNVEAFAHEEARRLCHDYVGSEHLLLAVIREGSAVHVFGVPGLTLAKARGKVEEEIPRGSRERDDLALSPVASAILEGAEVAAEEIGVPATPSHIAEALLAYKGTACEILDSLKK